MAEIDKIVPCCVVEYCTVVSFVGYKGNLHSRFLSPVPVATYWIPNLRTEDNG